MVESSSLRDAFLEELRVLYNAEQQLTSALPRMAAMVSYPALRTALDRHAEETRIHQRRLEEAFVLLHELPRARYCAGIAGIVEDVSAGMTKEGHSAVTDVCIIAGGQRAERYRMAAYATGVALAKALGLPEIARLLSHNLQGARAADDQLTAMFEGRINEAAINGPARTQRAEYALSDAHPA